VSMMSRSSLAISEKLFQMKMPFIKSNWIFTECTWLQQRSLQAFKFPQRWTSQLRRDKWFIIVTTWTDRELVNRFTQLILIRFRMKLWLNCRLVIHFWWIPSAGHFVLLKHVRACRQVQCQYDKFQTNTVCKASAYQL
jgi:hypothetical protein